MPGAEPCGSVFLLYNDNGVARKIKTYTYHIFCDHLGLSQPDIEETMDIECDGALASLLSLNQFAEDLVSSLETMI